MQFLYSHLRKLEQQQRDRPNPLTRKELTKIRAEINQIETKRRLEHINKTKSLFFERINKIDKPMTRLIKKKRERTQINKIMNERGEITTNTEEIQKLSEHIISNYMPTN